MQLTQVNCSTVLSKEESANNYHTVSSGIEVGTISLCSSMLGGKRQTKANRQAKKSCDKFKRGNKKKSKKKVNFLSTSCVWIAIHSPHHEESGVLHLGIPMIRSWIYMSSVLKIFGTSFHNQNRFVARGEKKNKTNQQTKSRYDGLDVFH